MSSKHPKNRRKFSEPWDQMLHLYGKALYWFYRRRCRHRALYFCKALERLLRVHAREHTVIKGEECWSLVCEVKGDIRKAISYRESEIRLRRRLLRIGTADLNYYKEGDLADCMDLLAILYREAGDTAKAIKVLRQSQRVCSHAGIRFDGKDILAECLTSRKQALASRRERSRKPTARR